MRTISLSNSSKVAIVDDEDYADASQYVWRLQKATNVSRDLEYVVRSAGRGVIVPIHRQIANPKSQQVVDHINGDGLDNRRNNLRVCTNQQNLWNRKAEGWGGSKFKGVYFEATRSRWVAQLVKNGKKIRRICQSETEAAITYNNLAMTHFGEYARLNAV